MAKRYELSMFGLDVIMRHDYEVKSVADKINEYRKKSVESFSHFLTNVPKSDSFRTFLDVGAGDDHDVNYFKSLNPQFSDCLGCDLYLDGNDYNDNLVYADWYTMAETGVKGIFKFDCVYINHSMEHAANIYALMEQVSKMHKSGGALFVAVPDGTTPFGYAITSSTTHFSVVTEGFLRTTLQRFGYNVEVEQKEFRPGAKELWAYAIKH